MTDTWSETKTTQWTIGEIAAIQYALVHKALMKYPVYRFQTLKRCFPNVASTREFITSAEYLGGIRLEIVSREARPSMTTLYRAVFSALGRIADSVSGIEETYGGRGSFTHAGSRMCSGIRWSTIPGLMTAGWACRKATFP